MSPASSDEYTSVLQELQQQRDEQRAAAEEAKSLLLESGHDEEVREVGAVSYLLTLCLEILLCPTFVLKVFLQMLHDVINALDETGKLIAATEELQAVILDHIYR